MNPLIPESLSTDRFRLKRICLDHEDLIYAMHSDERVMATLAGVKTRDVNRTWVEVKVRHWEEHGFGLYAFFDKSGEFVGRGGLLYVEIEGAMEVELNYSIAADHWGQGYATEAGKVILEAGRRFLDTDRIVAFTLARNIASQRVMQKLGMICEKNFIHHNHPSVLYHT